MLIIWRFEWERRGGEECGGTLSCRWWEAERRGLRKGMAGFWGRWQRRNGFRYNVDYDLSVFGSRHGW